MLCFSCAAPCQRPAALHPLSASPRCPLRLPLRLPLPPASPSRVRASARGSDAQSRPLVSKLASTALKLLIRSTCAVADGLEVDVDAATNMDVLSGRLRGVTVRAARIVFDGVPISGSVALFTPSMVLPLEEPLAVSVVATATEADLNAAGTKLRGLLEKLVVGAVTNSLSGRLGMAVGGSGEDVETVLERVSLEDPGVEGGGGGRGLLRSFVGGRPRSGGGRMVMNVRSSVKGGATVRYVVRAGLVATREGAVVELDDPELLWRGLPVPLGALARVGVQFENDSRLTSVAISADGVFCEVGLLAASHRRYVVLNHTREFFFADVVFLPSYSDFRTGTIRGDATSS